MSSIIVAVSDKRLPLNTCWKSVFVRYSAAKIGYQNDFHFLANFSTSRLRPPKKNKGFCTGKVSGSALSVDPIGKGLCAMRPFAASAFVLCLSSSGAAAASCADLSLVLAIDSSGSIDQGEFALQVLGYATAFQSPEVQRVLAATGVVDVAAVFWADADFAFQTIPWVRITSSRDAEFFAAMIASIPRLTMGDTDIGSGLNFALDMLNDPNRCSIRSIVNVSGDGRESSTAKRNFHVPLAVARERAAGFDVTVNGLAILNDDHGLAQYYQDKLISGPGAFVMDVEDFTTFGAAIEKKLVREIGLPLSSSLNLVDHPL